MERLPEQVEPGTVLPLQALYADLVCRQPGPPYLSVCGLQQSNLDPTIDVYARPGVGLPPIFFEAAGYPLQVIRHLHTN